MFLVRFHMHDGVARYHAGAGMFVTEEAMAETHSLHTAVTVCETSSDDSEILDLGQLPVVQDIRGRHVTGHEQLQYARGKIVAFRTDSPNPENEFLAVQPAGSFGPLSRARTFSSFRAARMAAPVGGDWSFSKLDSAFREIVQLFVFRETSGAVGCPGMFTSGYVVARSGEAFSNRFVGWDDREAAPTIIGNIQNCIAFRNVQHANYLAAALNRHDRRSTDWGVLYRDYGGSTGRDRLLPVSQSPSSASLAGYRRVDPGTPPFPIPIGTRVFLTSQTCTYVIVGQYHNAIFAIKQDAYNERLHDTLFQMPTHGVVLRAAFSSITLVENTVAEKQTDADRRMIVLEPDDVSSDDHGQ